MPFFGRWFASIQLCHARKELIILGIFTAGYKVILSFIPIALKWKLVLRD